MGTSTKSGENWEWSDGRITFYGQSGWERDGAAVLSWIYDEEACEMIEHPLKDIDFTNLIESIIGCGATSQPQVSPRAAVILFLLGIITKSDLDHIKEGNDEDGDSYIDIHDVKVCDRNLTIRITKNI